jgi:hypothetical protein
MRVFMSSEIGLLLTLRSKQSMFANASICGEKRFAKLQHG